MFKDCSGKAANCFPPTRQRARYIDRGGEQSYAPPTLSEQSLLYGFWVEGALSRLQGLCDRILNAPAKRCPRNPLFPPLDYRPATHFVMVSFGYNPALRSQAPNQKNTGFVPEHEVIIWVLTMAGRQIGPFFWIDHLAWFTPYVFVDSSYAMATGREVYGFPKEWGWVSMPDKPSQFDHLIVEADVFPTISPTVGVTRQPVITINRHNGSNKIGDCPANVLRDWRTQGDCFNAITQELFKDERAIALPGFGLPLNGLFDLFTRSVPFVFLKQFRAASNGEDPCYQAIVEADAQLVKFRGGGLLDPSLDLHVTNFASHPIVSELGLGSTSPPIKVAFWTEFDFTIERGREIVRTV